jgi:hypothetical protein
MHVSRVADGDVEEQERLFLFGLDQGRKFLEAVQAHKVTKEDLSTEPPLIMLMLLQGPTPDFILGRVFESAQKSALGDVITRPEGAIFDDETKRLNARTKFVNQNCKLLDR